MNSLGIREQMESEQASAKQTKSKDILEKILMGKLNKRLNEICLLGQVSFVTEILINK
jgi:translation elongation factor EF-Ts